MQSQPPTDGVDAGAGLRLPGCASPHEQATTAFGPPATWPQPLHTLLDVMRDARQPMFLAWGDARTLLYNAAYAPLLGRKHPGAAGRHFLEVWEEVRAELTPMVDRVFDGHSIHMDDIELFLDRRGRLEEAHFAFSYTPVRTQDGPVLGLLCVCADTTAQVLAQRRRGEEVERLHVMFAQAPGSVAIVRGPEHRFELANPAFTTLFDRSDLHGLPARTAFPHLGRMVSRLDQVFRTGEAFVGHAVPVVLPQAADRRPEPGSAPGQGSGRGAGHDVEHWLDLVLQPLREPGGRIDGIFIQITDVSERVRAEAASAANERRWRRLFERLHEAFCLGELVRDGDGRVVDWRCVDANPAWGRLVGLSPQEAIGRSLDAVLPGQGWVGEVAAVAAGAEPIGLSGRFPRTGRWFEGSALRLQHDGFAAIFLDVTERHLSDARRVALLELDDRLRDPSDLAAMASAASAILGRALGADRAGYAALLPDGETIAMVGNWHAAAQYPDVAAPLPDEPAQPRHLSELGLRPELLAAGTAVEIEDAGAGRPEAAGRALVGLPVIEQERPVALFFVQAAAPRHWNEAELALLRNVAERTHSAIQRLRAEAGLRALAASLEAQVAARTRERDQIWHASRDLLCVASLEGYMVSLNPAWVDTLGWSEAELMQRPFIEFIHPDDVARTIEAAAGLADGRPQLNFENRYRCRDGSYRWLSWNSVPQHGAIYASVRDVTAVRAQAAELRRSRAMLRTMFETSYQLQALLAPDGIVLEANAMLLAAIGGTPDAVLGRLFWETPWFGLTSDMPERVRLAVAAAAGGEGRQMTLVLGTAPPGIGAPAGPSQRSYDFSVRPLRDATGAVIALVAEAVDTTERLQAEEQLRQSQKMEAVGQLTGGLAHDFNNLLTGISGSLELLQTRVAQGRTDALDRYVVAAQEAARRAASLTHRLLAFSRRQTLDPRPIDVNRLVAGMEELVRRTVGPGIAVVVEATPEPWPTLCDPGQLENALLNLCINARDAMPDGGRLTISTANHAALPPGPDHVAGVGLAPAAIPPAVPQAAQGQGPHGYVSLCVGDDGTGMTPDVIARAFDPFFTTKPIGKGTGLGLSMIYGFIQQSGGQVRIRSQPGAGTEICLYLPRGRDDILPAAKAAGADQPSGMEGGHTVLVVDDEPTIRMLAADVLREAGCIVLEAGEGSGALELLRTHPEIDLLVSDVGLPGGLNGRQLAEAAHLLRPGLPVLFITGYAETAVLSAGHLAPGMHVMTKPFPLETLVRRVREVMGRP